MSFRPSIQHVATSAIKAEDSLKVEPQYRSQLSKGLSDARIEADVPGISLAAFTLAYSYDHYAPYDFEQSRTLLSESLSYFPEWPEALFNRGVVHIHLRKFREAIQDFEQAERALDKAGLPLNTTVQDAILTKGKLLIFQAEALCGRGQSGDLEIARTNLVRAEVYFLTISSNAPEAAQARFWINQIPSRIKATIPAALNQDTRTISHPSAFLIGLILVPFLMMWMVKSTTPQNSGDSKGGGISEQTKMTGNTKVPSSQIPAAATSPKKADASNASSEQTPPPKIEKAQ